MEHLDVINLFAYWNYIGGCILRKVCLTGDQECYLKALLALKGLVKRLKRDSDSTGRRGATKGYLKEL